MLQQTNESVAPKEEQKEKIEVKCLEQKSLWGKPIRALYKVGDSHFIMENHQLSRTDQFRIWKFDYEGEKNKEALNDLITGISTFNFYLNKFRSELIGSGYSNFKMALQAALMFINVDKFKEVGK